MPWLPHIWWVFILVATVAVASPSSGQSDLTLGEQVYERACLECHGAEGHGDGETARERNFKARDFELGAFKCRCTPSGELPTDEDLLRTVTNGVPGTPMPRFENSLTLEERRAVVRYVKSLTPSFQSGTAPSCIPVPEPVAATPELIREGEQIYRVMRCWTCHGIDGKGRGPAARRLRDDWGNRIRVYDFTRADRYKCGGSATDLYRLLHTGMTGSPMPSFDEAFLFPRESANNPRPFERIFDEESVAGILKFMDRQPDSAALDAMSPEEKRAFLTRRTWALVHYVRSLSAE